MATRPFRSITCPSLRFSVFGLEARAADAVALRPSSNTIPSDSRLNVEENLRQPPALRGGGPASVTRTRVAGTPRYQLVAMLHLARLWAPILSWFPSAAHANIACDAEVLPERRISCVERLAR